MPQNLSLFIFKIGTNSWTKTTTAKRRLSIYANTVSFFFFSNLLTTLTALTYRT